MHCPANCLSNKASHIFVALSHATAVATYSRARHPSVVLSPVSTLAVPPPARGATRASTAISTRGGADAGDRLTSSAACGAPAVVVMIKSGRSQLTRSVRLTAITAARLALRPAPHRHAAQRRTAG